MHNARKLSTSLPLALTAALALACTSSASAAPISGPKPPEPKPDTPPKPEGKPGYGDACKPGGNVVFEIDHRVMPGAKLATSTVKLFGNGAWTRAETSAEGQAQAPTSGCLGKLEARHIASELRTAPWKVTTARVHCMAMSATFTEYQVDGKLVFTQKLCSGQSLDDKSRAALEAAIAKVEPTAAPTPAPSPPAAPTPPAAPKP